jgi:hypothetical protein
MWQALAALVVLLVRLLLVLGDCTAVAVVVKPPITKLPLVLMAVMAQFE